MPLRATTRKGYQSIVILSKNASKRPFSSQRTRDPLRILFCGSDEFSIVSLKAIHEEHKINPESIETIDVVCRPPKRVGRGLKLIREVPITEVARNLSLPIHEVDTFTNWAPPTPRGSPINLIIAVSYGRLVPPRILNGAKYGGLNIHPSMLPDFHGPAPLHHTLLNDCSRTGITLQSMHPEHFDQGLILDQTPYPGFVHKCSTVPELIATMAPLGAEMLVRAIRNSTFVPPYEPKGWEHEGKEGVRRPAPKITSEDSYLDWQNMPADEILRRQRVIGPLWSKIESPSNPEFRERRVIWTSGFSKVPLGSESAPDGAVGVFAVGSNPDTQIAHARTCDGQVLQMEKVKLDHEREKPSVALLRELAAARLVT